MTEKVYTYDEVAKHNKPDDCWLIIGDHVYNATDYINEHPGGPIVLSTRAGKIVTVGFDQASHSKHAREVILPTKRIGRIDKASTPEMWQVEAQTQTSPLLLVLVILAIVTVVYFITQR